MDTYTLPIIALAALGILGWWGVNMTSAFRGNRRKIAARLSGAEKNISGPRLSSLSVILPEEAATMPAFLQHKPYIQTLQRKLAHSFSETSPQKFLTIMAICAIIPASIVGAVTQHVLATFSAFVIGGYLPLMVVNFRCNARLTKLIRQLPEALDFLSRIMKAGHSLSTGLQMMAEELPKPISEEFRKVYDGHSLGQPLEEALKEMSGRVDSTDFSFFVTAVLIQRQTGGDLSEVLGNISRLVRSRMRLAQSVSAKTAEGKFTGYILVAFPIAMFTICWYLNPELYGGFMHQDKGKQLLGTAGGLVLLGLFCIRKITTVRV